MRSTITNFTIIGFHSYSVMTPFHLQFNLLPPPTLSLALSLSRTLSFCHLWFAVQVSMYLLLALNSCPEGPFPTVIIELSLHIQSALAPFTPLVTSFQPWTYPPDPYFCRPWVIVEDELT